MTRGTTILAFPRTPLSANRLGFRGDVRRLHADKRKWQDEITMALFAEQLRQRPQLRKVEASAVLQFPTRRRRDEGNYRIVLEKALGDALRGSEQAWPLGRWIRDDTPEHYTFKAVTFSEGEGPSRTVITLDWWLP